MKSMSEFRNSDAKKKEKCHLQFLFHFNLHSRTEGNLNSEAGKRKKKGLIAFIAKAGVRMKVHIIRWLTLNDHISVTSLNTIDGILFKRVFLAGHQYSQAYDIHRWSSMHSGWGVKSQIGLHDTLCYSFRSFFQPFLFFVFYLFLLFLRSILVPLLNVYVILFLP
ncbi:hypothetical protein BDV36DRAFT_65281 [Aspergillus pseudocaelatus]|uniref:Uncharacterized protein n=1 Tax=Aspergillus pseudocaelatus TaxID=1825620 RepID=A0ABQ6W4Y0_9EURO|nr:hypothetical protein BDV36DRAFT_65281 [Aspergillus pseudocaelatus]